MTSTRSPLTSSGKLRRFLHGFGHVPRGIRFLLGHPRLLLLAFAPALVSALLVGLGLVPLAWLLRRFAR